MGIRFEPYPHVDMADHHINELKKKFFYKNISKGHHNTQYSQEEILCTVVQLCKHGETIGEYCDTPSSDTIYRRLKLDIEELISSYEDVTFPILKHFLKKYSRERWDIVIDPTEEEFFGKKGDEHVMGNKEGGKCFKFLHVVVSCRRARIPVSIVPLKKGCDKVNILRRILKKLLKVVKPFNFLADAGFGDGPTIKLLQQLKLNFVVRVKVAGEIKRFIEKGKHYDVHSFELADKSRVYFHVKCGKQRNGDGWALATSHYKTHSNHLWSWYGRRWEIENAFKTQDRVQFKTASRYCKMRLFAQMVTALLYLLWTIWNCFSSLYYTIKRFVRLIACAIFSFSQPLAENVKKIYSL